MAMEEIIGADPTSSGWKPDILVGKLYLHIVALKQRPIKPQHFVQNLLLYTKLVGGERNRTFSNRNLHIQASVYSGKPLALYKTFWSEDTNPQIQTNKILVQLCTYHHLIAICCATVLECRFLAGMGLIGSTPREAFIADLQIPLDSYQP